MYEADYGDLIGKLWNCSDQLDGEIRDMLGGDVYTYATAVRAIRRWQSSH